MKYADVQVALDRMAADELPRDSRLWERIDAKLHRRNRLRPRTRLGWTVVLVGMIAFSSVVVYAVDTALRQAIHADPGLDAAYMAQRGQELDLSQTIGTVTVTLQWVYADTNRVAVGYTLKDVSGKRYNNFGPWPEKLTTEDGTALQMDSGFGTAIQYAADGKSASQAFVTSYLPPHMGQSDPLKLHLSVMLEGIDPTLAANPNADADHLGPSFGPFTFDFAVSMDAGRYVEPNQTTESASIQMTLKAVTVTISETRATLCFQSPDPALTSWAIVASFKTPKQQYDPMKSGSGESRQISPDCIEATFVGAYYDDIGNWTLTVTDLVAITQSTSGETPAPKRYHGNWSFTFEVK